MNHLFYNRRGEPITSEQQTENWKGRTWDESFRVALKEQDDIRVSTVFLGLNHQYSDGPPLIFETMIFGGEHDVEQWRYTTEAEALQGHEVAVALAFEPQENTGITFDEKGCSCGACGIVGDGHGYAWCARYEPDLAKENADE